MARKNYSKMSKKPEIAEETVVTEQQSISEDQPAVESAPAPEAIAPVVGVVVDCGKLNVRTNPSSTAEVLCEVRLNSELIIDTEKSNSKWLKVCTPAGIEGFCMKQFIEIQK